MSEDTETARAEQTLKDLQLYKEFVAKCPNTMERFSQFTGSEELEPEPSEAEVATQLT